MAISMPIIFAFVAFFAPELVQADNAGLAAAVNDHSVPDGDVAAQKAARLTRMTQVGTLLHSTVELYTARTISRQLAI